MQEPAPDLFSFTNFKDRPLPNVPPPPPITAINTFLVFFDFGSTSSYVTNSFANRQPGIKRRVQDKFLRGIGKGPAVQWEVTVNFSLIYQGPDNQLLPTSPFSLCCGIMPDSSIPGDMLLGQPLYYALGMIERFHRTFEDILRPMMQSAPATPWTQLLIPALTIYRYRPQEHGFSPFYLLFGTARPSTAAVAYVREETTEEDTAAARHRAIDLSDLQGLRDCLASVKYARSVIRSRLQNDKAANRHFGIGDWVLRARRAATNSNLFTKARCKSAILSQKTLSSWNHSLTNLRIAPVEATAWLRSHDLITIL